MCNLLPSTLAQSCKTFIAQYTPKIVELLVSQFPPDKICSMLMLCGTEKVETRRELTYQELKYDVSIECTICEVAMNQLETVLAKEATQVSY